MTFFYETKCRRCGEIFSHPESGYSKQAFAYIMLEKMLRPFVISCKSCKKDTVQDLVYFEH